MARRFSQHFTRFEMDENSNPATIIPSSMFPLQFQRKHLRNVHLDI